MSNDTIALPRLSDKSLEGLAIAVMKLETTEGLKCSIPLEWALTPQVLAQFPASIIKRVTSVDDDIPF